MIYSEKMHPRNMSKRQRARVIRSNTDIPELVLSYMKKHRGSAVRELDKAISEMITGKAVLNIDLLNKGIKAIESEMIFSETAIEV